MDTSITFSKDDTRKMQMEVRTLFDAMSGDFKHHLMKSFMWSQENLESYLSRDVLLKGNILKDAYSHLESLLERIESYASDSNKPFPSYEEWVNKEYQNYKASLREDKEDIERLIGEGGVVSPGKTSPVDTMEDDTLAHYNQLKIDHEHHEARGKEAVKLMQMPAYRHLKDYLDQMSDIIMNDIKQHRPH